jgi:hypothetical protein
LRISDDTAGTLFRVACCFAFDPDSTFEEAYPPIELNAPALISSNIVARKGAMLETLTGRLKWERTVGGIRVEIPAHLSAKSGLNSISLGLVWLWIIGEDLFRWAMEAAHVSEPHWDRSATLLLIPLLILCWFLWIILTSTRLTLSADLLAIEYHVFGIHWLSWRCPTSLLHNPRYYRKSPGAPSFWSGPPELRIDRDYRTKVLAVRVNQDESDALVARMMEVYPFPKYLPTESAAGATAG